MGNFLFDSKCRKISDSMDENQDNPLLSQKRICDESFGSSPRSKSKGQESSKRSRGPEKNKGSVGKTGGIVKRVKKYLDIKEVDCRPAYLRRFLKLFDDDTIQDFLWNDGCAMLSDKYLLAMVYIYFRRAKLSTKEYNRLNFFAALFLAHDMEEDDDEPKHEIFPWALGAKWKSKFTLLITRRDGLLKRMNFRSAVSELTCKEVIDLCPEHPIWLRERQAYHGGASRLYPPDDEMPIVPKGPDGSPMFCDSCKLKLQTDFLLQNLPANTEEAQLNLPQGDSKSSRRFYGLNCKEE